MEKYEIDLKEIRKVENRGIIGAAFLSLGIFVMGVLHIVKFSFNLTGIVAIIMSILLFRAFGKASINRVNAWVKVNEILKNSDGDKS